MKTACCGNISRTLIVVLAVTIGALCSGCPRSPTYSNVFVFGDSKSDIGNKPTSCVLTDRWEDFVLNNNSYVPISNPILPATDTFQVPGTTTDRAVFPYPDLSVVGNYGFPQPLINNNERESLSLSWVHYLLAMGNNTGLITSPYVSPWAKVFGDRAGNNADLSVDFAFIGALTGNLCYLSSGPTGGDPLPPEECTPQYIFDRLDDCRQHCDSPDHFHSLSLPATGVQVDLLLDGLINGYITSDDNSLYIFWAGGNNIGSAISALLKGDHNPVTFVKEMFHTIPDEIAGANPDSFLSRLVNSRASPKHILIVSQDNLGISDAILDSLQIEDVFLKRIVARLFNSLFTAYNATLRHKVATFPRPHDVSIRMVDMQRPINRTVRLLCPKGPFADEFGKEVKIEYFDELAAGDAVNSSGYLFYDGAHFTSQGQQVVAYTILKSLQDPGCLSSKTSPPPDEEIKSTVDNLLQVVSQFRPAPLPEDAEAADGL